MQSVKSIAWLAGILEGEGYFSLSPSPTITLSMTDEDIVRKVAQIFKRPYNLNPKAGSKMQYRVNVCGTPAIEWMFTIYSLMGERRKFKITEIINEWKKQFSRSKYVFPCGHEKNLKNTYYSNRSSYCKQCCIENSRKSQLRKTALLQEKTNGRSQSDFYN